MTWAVISTSSPLVSVALFKEGELLGTGQREAAMRASGGALALLKARLESAGMTLRDIELFAADVGPGSFMGVKVGVTLAKTFAYAHKTLAAGISAFDLINPTAPVAIPSRKGVYHYREGPQKKPEQASSGDRRVAAAVGYGADFSVQRYPLAERAGALLDSLQPMDPVRLVPDYVLPPSISKPKRPFTPVPE